jgi:hypothetical protein
MTTSKHQFWHPAGLMDHCIDKGDNYQMATKHYQKILYDYFFFEMNRRWKCNRSEGAAKINVNEGGRAAKMIDAFPPNNSLGQGQGRGRG